MDITKYLKNKDIELSNDDLNIEKLEKDIRKGYVLSEEVDNARKEAVKESTSKYTELETKYNNLEKSFNDLQAKNVETTKSNGGLKLQLEMMKQKFPEDKLEQVSKLRTTVYAEVEDDTQALEKIKEDFKGTFFPTVEKVKTEVPEETNFKASPKTEDKISITRKTSIKNFFKN